MKCSVCNGELRKNAYGVCQRTRACKLKYMEYYNFKKYGITFEQYHVMLAAQGGHCAICSATEGGGRGAFHVDHDHVTGKVRGLLCHYCNTAVGNMKDDPALLRAAANYLEARR